MATQGVSRRDILRTLAFGAVGGSVLQVIPAQAAEFAHQAVRKEKARAGSLAWLFERYRETGAWNDLSGATRRQREIIMRGVLLQAGNEPATGLMKRLK